MCKLSLKKLMLFWLYVLTCPAVFMFTGCVHFNGNERDYNIFKADAGSVRQIEPLVLEEAEEETAEYSPVEPELPEIEISLEKCRALTLENNLDLTVQLIEPTIAAELVSQEEARFEATFTGRAQYSSTNSPSAYSLDISGNKVDSFYTDLGVSLPLRTGGEIKVDLIDSRLKTNSFFPTFNPSYESDITASISQPLLRDAGNRVNTYRIRAAEYNRQIIDTQTKLQAIRIIADVDIAYWRLYAVRRMLDVRRQRYELAKALFEQTERLVDVGMKPKIELIRTKAGMADQLQAIISAENDVRQRERELKRRLNKPGLGMETKTVLIPTTKPDPVRYALDRERMVANALENRMEMLEMEIRLAQDADNIEYQKNQSLPDLRIQYQYNINGLGPERGDSYDLLFDHDFDDHRLGLQLSLPFGNGAAKSRLRQSIYERAKRLATRDSRKAQIKYEVLNQIDTLEANWQRILASRQTTILRDEQYKAEKRQYELGLAISTDVLEAQTNLADAQTEEIRALTEYQIAFVDLAYATGTLLGAAKVQLEPIVPQK
jgi:outer membrane protein